MNATRLGAAVPYVVLLAVAAAGFVLAGRIDYPARTGQLGPDFWPKVALGLIMAVCVFELVKLMIFKTQHEAHGIADQLEAGEEEDDAPRQLFPLVAGGALTVAYGVFISVLGFPVATFLYAVAFMYVGGFRSHLVIWLSSLLGVALLSFLFLRVVYVSLPRGVPPFDRVTDAIIGLF